MIRKLEIKGIFSLILSLIQCYIPYWESSFLKEIAKFPKKSFSSQNSYSFKIDKQKFAF